MTLLPKRKLLIGLLLVVVAAAVYLTWGGYVHAQPSSVTIQTTAAATTTVSYLNGGSATATSTYQFDNPVFSSGKVANMMTTDSGTLYVQFTASTSPARLVWYFQCSNNNIDWYATDQASSTLGSTVASTTLVTSPIASCVTFHERVTFYVAGGLNGSYYAELDLKKNPSTP